MAQTDRLTVLKPAQVTAELETVPGWKGKDQRKAIQRTYTFPSFRAALAFTQFAGEIAEFMTTTRTSTSATAKSPSPCPRTVRVASSPTRISRS